MRKNIDEKLQILDNRYPSDDRDYSYENELLYRARKHSLNVQLSHHTSKLRSTEKHLQYIRGNTNDEFAITTNIRNRHQYEVSFRIIRDSRITTNIRIYFNLPQRRNSTHKLPPSNHSKYKIQSRKLTTKAKKSQKKKNSNKKVPRRRYASIVKDANRPEGQTDDS